MGKCVKDLVSPERQLFKVSDGIKIKIVSPVRLKIRWETLRTAKS